MPLTRFPDHEDKRVFLSTVPALNLPPAPGAYSDRPSVAVLWLDQGSPALAELTHEFAFSLIEHGGLGIVLGGSGAEAAAVIFDEAAAETTHAEIEDEAIGIWADASATVGELLFTAAEEAMPPDAFAGQPWDIVVWARSGDPAVPAIRRELGQLSALVDERYELGGEDDDTDR
ncbi:MAG: hypothetical protein OEV95_00865 [Gemmatimonadota bacterium]|nr:hypothetical protein [Gemmatimonadota bacterium]MDH5282615.1 hypothetical protein [Gemmatimonadota bacterium]